MFRPDLDETASAIVRCIGRDWISRDDIVEYVDSFVPTDIVTGGENVTAAQARRARRNYILKRLGLWVGTHHLESIRLGGKLHYRRSSHPPPGSIADAMAAHPGGKGRLV